MSQFQQNQNDPPREDCHPPTSIPPSRSQPQSQPAMSSTTPSLATASRYPVVAPDYVSDAKAPSASAPYLTSARQTVELDSPFISEPRMDSPVEEYKGAPTPTSAATADSPTSTPIAERSSVRFPRVAHQPPERQGTAKPRDYYQPRRRAYGEGSIVRDQKLADMGTIRMGTSALISALSALPLKDEDTSSDEADDEAGEEVMRESTVLPPQRPRMPRRHSSLQTLRPMAQVTADEPELHSPRASVSAGTDNSVSPDWSPPRSPHHSARLNFPYKENVITRRARGPSQTEIAYQHAPTSPERSLLPLRGASSSTLKQIAAETGNLGGHDGMTPTTFEDGLVSFETSEKTPQTLQRVFGLEEEEELIEELHCWLLRADMLQGYMYLTRQHICFFAMVAPVEDEKIKSGPLWKKASRTKLSTRYWVTLRNDVLSWFESANDPYFPKGNVSLQYALTCELVDDTRFKVRMPERNYTFQSDTAGNALEWVRVIQKVIAKIQHEGQGVKLIIPWEAVYEVERSPTLEFQETIEIKVVDADDAMSIDSYFFASFPDNNYAHDLLQRLLRERPVSELPSVTPLSPRHLPAPDTVERKRDSGRFSFTGLSAALPIPKFGGDKGESKISVPIAPPAVLDLPDSSSESVAEADSERSDDDDDEATRRRKGYPPRQTGPPPPGLVHTPSSGWAPTEWIRRGSKQLFGSSPGSESHSAPRPLHRPPRKQPSVTEVVEGYHFTSTDDESESDVPLSVPSMTTSFTKLASPRSSSVEVQDDSVAIKFRKTFALPDKELLIDHTSGSLYRVWPISGRFFVSSNYFCFRSSALLNKTKMIVPIRQLYGMKAQKAFRFGHHGLIVIIKGHEELFLEFHSARRRDELMALLEERMDDLRQVSQSTHAIEDMLPGTPAFTDDMSGTGDAEPATGQGLMFNSTTSSFLQFKPDPMTIVCLTIGSRGDVQPYIALCKGLLAEGHTCRIATHAEYKDWVEGHGIGFAPVGGDPAKLMELCVDNGMFTIAFLKEGLQMFRGWLDDLLNDSWTACQGADLLIESPSAMAGIHVAEALQIPYYRAFTMPWTRTRAYPQAFAIPEHKRGGSYNYMTYVMFDNVFWRAISGQVNRWRKTVLGIDSTSIDKLQQDKVPFLYNFSPSVVPPPLDWTEWIHVSGYWFLDNADGKKDWTPPPGIVEFIDNAHASGKKVVYIGFGSIVVSDPHEMTRCVVQGIVDSGVCAILSKGWSDRGSRGKADQPELEAKTSRGADGVEYPPEIFSVDAIDHSWLFPRIDAACHHGGAGTTGASLRAGIPTIIKPFFGDQYFWAERVESLGVGSGLRTLTYEGLATALIEATTNERQIARAKVVGQTIRQEEGVQRAIEAIYRDLEYARSIIKPPPGARHRTSHSSLSLSRSGSRTHYRKSSSGIIERSASQVLLHSHSHSHSRTRSMDHEGGARSDESWSVVSDSGAGSLPSSPRHDVERTDSSDDEGHHRHHHRHHIPVISNLVNHLIPHLHGSESDKSSKGVSPKPPRSPK